MPISDIELERLWCELESDRVERKAMFSDPDKVRQAVCAFANDLPNHHLPGVIFIGVNDTGSCAHTPITDELLRNLSMLRDDALILPLPSLIVQKRNVVGCEVAVVIVEPSDAPPVRLRGQTWIRVGPRRAIATIEEERRLSEKRRAKDLPFDLWPVRSATLTDLDPGLLQEYLASALAPEVLAENQRSNEERLISLRFTTLEGIPTVVGILVCGIDPQNFFPGAYVQFIRFDGVNLEAPILNQMEISGPLPQILRNLNDLIKANISTSLRITAEPTDVRYPDYPLRALQQLVYNSVLHRAYEGTNAPVRFHWFTDHIEILNPGGPYGQVTIENFGQPGVTDYRNPHLAEAMKNLGFIQRFGVGIQIARRELERNGNPPPQFQIQPTHVLVLVRRRL